MTKKLSLIWALVTGGMAVLGGVKSLASVSTGQEWTLHQCAYWVGLAGVCALIAFAITFGVLALLASMAEDGPDELIYAGVAVGLAIAGLVLFRADLTTFEEASQSVRIYGALIGLAFAALSVLVWRRLRAKEASQAPDSK